MPRGHDLEAIEVKLARLNSYLQGWSIYFRLAKRAGCLLVSTAGFKADYEWAR
ncbi:hypothetical protein CEK60_00440 [Halomonas sp. N3-2A]|nr:hypothetical protein CEK60_00440 [Halomonas sp. N3-2A]